jgi:hypothetical protein
MVRQKFLRKVLDSSLWLARANGSNWHVNNQQKHHQSSRSSRPAKASPENMGMIDISLFRKESVALAT